MWVGAAGAVVVVVVENVDKVGRQWGWSESGG
jgi:hypothetical protein